MNEKALRLDNQLCFPLYAASKEIIKRYKPYLDEIGLTYTQYITLLVLWEHNALNIKQLGEKLFLDSGTLTPVVKKLEAQKLVKRNRLPEDERNVIVELTSKGLELKAKALKIPYAMSKEMNIDEEEAKVLYKVLYKILGKSTKESN